MLLADIQSCRDVAFVKAVKRRLGPANLLHGVYKAALRSGKAALDLLNARLDVI
jgi:hypothetical protein